MIYYSRAGVKPIFFLLAVLIKFIFPFTSQFTNYKSAVSINDILIKNSIVWAATSGGLMKVNLLENKIELNSDVNDFYDLSLKALCVDNSDNIWIGSERGYLYCISKKGRKSVYTPYSSSGWGISNIYLHGKYLIIGSPKGCSIFDTEKKSVIQNAVFESNEVHSIAIIKDTLYLGCNNKVFKLDISGNKLVTSNFYDETIWIQENTNNDVLSFPIVNDSVLYLDVVSKIWNNSLYYVIDNSSPKDTIKNLVFKKVTEKDTVLLFEMSSAVQKDDNKVISIAFDDNGILWFGTKKNNLFKWDGNELRQFKLDGLTLIDINRIHLAKNGDLWMIPHVNHILTIGRINFGEPWWQGISRFNGKQWNLYNYYNTNNFYHLGRTSDFMGIGEDQFGNMWFGTNGTHIRKYNPNTNQWIQYYIGDKDKSTFKLFSGDSPMDWGKSSGIALDSSGYMWFTAHDSYLGSIFCFNPSVEDPSSSDYRYFFPGKVSDGEHMVYPNALNVDINGNIFMGGHEQGDNGRLVVFNHNGNPLKDSVNPTLYIHEGLIHVGDMASASDKSTWIASTNGLYNFYFFIRNIKYFIYIIFISYYILYL